MQKFVILVGLLNQYYIGYYTLYEVYFVYTLFWELAILLSSDDGWSVFYFKMVAMVGTKPQH
jgi:hypothetical protein